MKHKRFSAKRYSSNAIMHQYEKVSNKTFEFVLNEINNNAGKLEEIRIGSIYANYKAEYLLVYPDKTYYKISKRIFDKINSTL